MDTFIEILAVCIVGFILLLLLCLIIVAVDKGIKYVSAMISAKRGLQDKQETQNNRDKNKTVIINIILPKEESNKK